MATVTILGPTYLRGGRDNDGHRTYKIQYKLKSDVQIGPATIINLSNDGILPAPGQTWQPPNLIGEASYEIDNWAWFTEEIDIEPMVENEKNLYWLATFTCSTNLQARCNCKPKENPLEEPSKITGSFVKYTEEAVVDLNGKPIKNSAHEPLRGPQVEFDDSRPTVRIERYMYDPNIEMLSNYKDSVNDAPLWGLPARTIKLSNISFEELYYEQCQALFKVVLEFDINYKTFDRTLLDEGTKALNGHWSEDGTTWVLEPIGGQTPDPANPNHYKRYVDRTRNTTTVILDGAGQPYNPLITSTGACSVCGTSPFAPNGWWLYGLPDWPEGILLTHTTGCTWAAVQNSSEREGVTGQITLSYDAGRDDKWQIVCVGAHDDEVIYWYLNNPGDDAPDSINTVFKCKSENRFQADYTPTYLEGVIPVEPGYDPPKWLSIVPRQTVNQPGKIFVAKYVGRNLLALGIPESIGTHGGDC